MFESLTTSLNGVFSRLRGKGRLTDADVDQALREVRLALLEADVNVGVVRNLVGRIRVRAVGSEVTKSLTPGQQVIKIVHSELVATLGGETAGLVLPKGTNVILLVGLQGSGKTTTAAKLAAKLKGEGRRPLLVAADVYRPAAIEQLQTLGTRLGIPVYADPSAKPTTIVKAAIKEAAAANHDVVIVDTAGRLQIDSELMAELNAISKAADPAETLLVVDAMTGQDAVNVAKGFAEAAPLTGLIMTKLDGDARGGAAISVREVTGAPIKFVGTGEQTDDLEAFHPERMASRILGMGDVLTLIEKAETAWDIQEAEAMVDKMTAGQMTLDDFLDQFQQVRKMGSMNQLLAMLPGAGSALADVQISDRDLARVEAIIRSMTPGERRNPKMISGSRKRRIAAGSGTSPQDVNGLLRQFAQTQKMMKAMAGGRGFPGLPGIPGLTPPRKKR